MKKKLRTQRRAVAELCEDEIEASWDIFAATYEGVDEENFRRDLAEKDRVITLHDRRDDRILGFSTVVFSRVSVGEKRVWVLFSGDTALRPEAWGDRSMMTGFVQELIRFRLLHPFAPFYWFLISKGFKTYLLMARNFHVYWPRHDQKTPAAMRELIKGIVVDRFPKVNEEGEALFILPAGHGKVKEGLAPLTNELMRYADIRFFAEANPEHAKGDELCCVGLVNWKLITTALLKIARRQRSDSAARSKPQSTLKNEHRPFRAGEVKNA